ncbi:MAG: HipA domain-containing protein [Bacteroidota bacterium]
MQHLDQIKCINYNGFSPKFKDVLILRKGYYFIVNDYSITGDAPKDFIRLYEYGSCNKLNSKGWPLYIAKTGHKWYPNESICEQLMTRLGECFGINIAQSKLGIGNNQLRFLSKYFLEKDQQLIHGAEIYSGFLSDDQFVKQVEDEGKARDFFTIRFTKRALKFTFGENVTDIFNDFVRMVLFDAIIGNNDRHYYNWGIVRHVKGKHKPFFSPVYDTARGLYWNESEENLSLRIAEPSIEKYVDNSRPKLGWENESDINHFKLIELLYMYRLDYNISDDVFKILSKSNLKNSLDVIQKEFKFLLSENRKNLISKCLIKRFEKLENIIN